MSNSEIPLRRSDGYDNHERPAIRSFTHDFAHHILGQKNRVGKVDGLEFLARPDINEPNRGIASEPFGEFFRLNEDFGVLFVAGLDMCEDFLDWKVVVALANLSKGFGGLEGATAAAADMVPAKKSPLSTRVRLKYLGHG